MHFQFYDKCIFTHLGPAKSRFVLPRGRLLSSYSIFKAFIIVSLTWKKKFYLWHSMKWDQIYFLNGKSSIYEGGGCSPLTVLGWPRSFTERTCAPCCEWPVLDGWLASGNTRLLGWLKWFNIHESTATTIATAPKIKIQAFVQKVYNLGRLSCRIIFFLLRKYLRGTFKVKPLLLPRLLVLVSLYDTFPGAWITLVKLSSWPPQVEHRSISGNSSIYLFFVR
jgi:hypothetical protein